MTTVLAVLGGIVLGVLGAFAGLWVWVIRWGRTW